MAGLFITLSLLVLGYAFGKAAEARHYRSIRERESATSDQLAITLEKVPLEKPIESTYLATGSVVVSIDYFKKFMSGLRMFFGGELHSYSSLIDRARREALLRMKESCKDAHLIINTRLETASISRGAKQSIGSIEVVAYGTAIRFSEPPSAPPPLPL